MEVEVGLLGVKTSRGRGGGHSKRHRRVEFQRRRVGMECNGGGCGMRGMEGGCRSRSKASAYRAEKKDGVSFVEEVRSMSAYLR